MSGLFLLTALIGIGLLIMWMIQNDDAVRIEDQKGLFRMLVPKDPSGATAKAAPDDARPQGRRPSPGRPPSQHPLFAQNQQPPRPAPSRQPERPKAPDEEEEIIHPLWQGRRPKRRP